MRLPRFTTRRLMVLVAVVAIAFGGRSHVARWRELAAQYEVTAEMHDPEDWRPTADMSPAQWAAYCQAVDDANRKGLGMMGRTYVYGPNPAHARRLVDYHNRLRAKYRRAARYPWLPVTSDPPCPE